MTVESGANIDAEYRHQTPLHYAAANGMLLQYSNSLHAFWKCFPSFIYWKILFDETGNAKCVEFLIEHGAVTDSKDSKDETPLETAVSHGKSVKLNHKHSS